MALKIEPWKPPGANEVEMAAVVALFRHALAQQNPPAQWPAVKARAALEEWFKVPKTVALVAKALTGKVEGLLVFRNESPIVRIIFVGALEQRRGIGSQLVATLRDICSTKGIGELKVTYSQKDAKSSSFFAKHGFGNGKPAGEAGAGFPLIEATAAVPATK